MTCTSLRPSGVFTLLILLSVLLTSILSASKNFTKLLLQETISVSFFFFFYVTLQPILQHITAF